MNENRKQTWTRRGFLKSSACAAVATTALGRVMNRQPTSAGATTTSRPRLPIVIASANGLEAVKRAMSMILQKAEPLDAVVAGVNIVEDDPKDQSVGLGGLPNADGVVELDACCMDGKTHKAGGVAALRNIRNPSSVAKLVMQRTPHVLLVGEGALRFAKAQGFEEENLLTEESRKAWLQWKADRAKDAERPTVGVPASRPVSYGLRSLEHQWGTITCLAVDPRGDVGGVTSTSGLAFKLPGRVGDSPIIGAGLYVDNQVGAAGATGLGELSLVNCSTFFVVELMRTGLHPKDACLEALKRVVDHAAPEFRTAEGRRKISLSLYAVAKDGRYGAASVWPTLRYSVHDGVQARHENGASLFAERPPEATPATTGKSRPASVGP